MHVFRCNGCDSMMEVVHVSRGHVACCPGCGTRLIKGTSLSFSGELALAFTALLLFIPAHAFPLIDINLLAVNISATAIQGAVELFDSFPFISALVIYTTLIAPLVYLLSVIGANLSVMARNRKWLLRFTRVIHFCRHWVMIDVMLVSLLIAGFKLRDFADVSPGIGLACLVALQIFVAILLSRVTPKRYWDHLSDLTHDGDYAINTETSDNTVGCLHCKAVQPVGETHCRRCNSKIHRRIDQSLQKTWASLLAATAFMIPANIFTISVLITNGQRLEDTIISGVAGLINQGMIGIAIIIFTASILVPALKIFALYYLLICIHIGRLTGQRHRMTLYRFVKWIGKWSMVDLCVIAIMVSLVDRGQILDFTPGPGAIAFGLVVVLTMISADALDSRLIWEKYER
ncbi:paraquat-inducible membrane protein A [Veronia nyctiphanis]|uniref:Paraquat-inducible membrane protein A n=1 Tax=Veronia nyctiphanis TaxID=1278244 RepID=A0A4Q0YYJ5_9GAMM|nr:paraquat-inducible protein A [Veronia nyctiphanis]RXJ74289.1 paraquat-inducible membrane protein A [Veronia nyctiphanis]